MKILKRLCLILLAVVILGLMLWGGSDRQNALAYSFDQNNLISDGEFIDTNAMNASEIQRFLESKSSYLKDYSDGGRSASQIIYDASHGYGDASGSINGISITSSTGTVSPKVLLVSLQKEQSLISKTTRDDTALPKAMGYGCPDSGSCSSAYAGFVKQVENAAWQFRYNYERAQGTGFSDYQVGGSATFSDWNGTYNVTFGNRATSALYRYTPHVYNGNYNFWNMFYNTYSFASPEYGHSFSFQNGYPTLDLGGSYNFSVTVTNTGRSTWNRGIVNLATNKSQDRISSFIREGDGSSGWISHNRIMMQESSVVPGETATFSFWMKAPSNMNSGTYREYFRLVADGITWMEDYGIYWDVRVRSAQETIANQYKHSWVSQNGFPTIARGGSYNFQVTVANTSAVTWQQNRVNLATSRGQDRISSFIREGDGSSGWISPNRIQMQESSVAPGQNATFSFWMKAPSNMSPGTYREYFRLVADGITWMEDYGIYWDVRVN